MKIPDGTEVIELCNGEVASIGIATIQEWAKGGGVEYEPQCLMCRRFEPKVSGCKLDMQAFQLNAEKQLVCTNRC
jgi:hypothetical protein